MIKYLTYFAFLLFSCINENEKIVQERVEYKLMRPNDSGEQYLTIMNSIVFYHGKVRATSIDSTESSSIYFLSKAKNRGANQNGNDNLMFYDFQYSDELLTISDFDSSKFNARGQLFSFDVYNSMWGDLKGDTITLRATKHIYASRSDEIKFICLESKN